MCLLLVGNMVIAILLLVAMIALVGIVDIFAPKVKFFKGHLNIVRLAISGIILLGIGWCLLSGLKTTMPVDNNHDDMLAEQLFINIRQDSLQQLMDKKNMVFKGAGLFNNKAILKIHIGASTASRKLTAELDTLARSFSKMLQVDLVSDNDIKLKCPAIKQNGITYVTVPAVVMINLMEQDYAIEIADNQKPQVSENNNRR